MVALWNSICCSNRATKRMKRVFIWRTVPQVDDDRPSQCLKMSRDLYRLQGGEWKRIETASICLCHKPAAK